MVQCELCKENLPDFIRHKGTLYNILQFDDETNYDNYMVLDTVSPDHMNNRYRYIVKFDENNMLKVGRGLEVQLMLSDISVSRVHTIFRIVNGDRVVMEDFNSKFGTLVLLQCPSMEILQGQMLTVQVGRSYFEISIKEPFSLFGCCTAREFDKKKSYDKINRKHVHIDKTTNIKEDKGEDESDEEEEKKENNIVIRKDKYLNVIREENKDKEDTHANQNKEEKIVINDKKTALE